MVRIWSEARDRRISQEIVVSLQVGIILCFWWRLLAEELLCRLRSESIPKDVERRRLDLILGFIFSLSALAALLSPFVPEVTRRDKNIHLMAALHADVPGRERNLSHLFPILRVLEIAVQDFLVLVIQIVVELDLQVLSLLSRRSNLIIHELDAAVPNVPRGFALLMAQFDLEKAAGALGVLSDLVIFLYFGDVERISQLEIS